ncbi:electron transport complex subunit RsxG [Thaumasiovibrio subtropicus]|uniref:electron transport complex subunit RsxG n=1 Tax=Thaumasiovibrio subtropicus TaxID=1891207 RepID=UPI000B35E4CA|nr:electron transport complex subunit RsxG [Thaumasiovibrio subtropicus]
MLNAIKNNAKVLTIAAVLSTGLVAVTHYLTAPTIAHQQQQQLLKTLNEVIPSDIYDNDLANSCLMLTAPNALSSQTPMPAYLATKQGEPTAIAIETIAPDGYNGTIRLIVGIALSGEVLGVRVLEHAETPGLGDKIDLRVSNWVESFVGRLIDPSALAPWAVRKDGGQFDQFTGATITPRAVVNAVKRTGVYFLSEQATIVRAAEQCKESQ